MGERVPEERIGETVVVEPNIACFRCGQCQRGLTSACENRLSVGMNRPGALAERLVVPSRFAWRVDGLEPETLVCVEPLTVVEAALRRLSRELPNAAMVVGAGPQGLLMCLALMMRGVEVHVLDVDHERLAFAGGLGAMIEPIDKKFDLVVDSVGSSTANESALLAALRPARSWFLAWTTDHSACRHGRWCAASSNCVAPYLRPPGGFPAHDRAREQRQARSGRIVAHEFALDDVRARSKRHLPGKTWVKSLPPDQKMARRSRK